MKKPEAKPAVAPTPEDVGAPTTEIDELHANVAMLEADRDRLAREVQDLRDRQLRARADYDNLVKRSARETKDAVRVAKAGLLLRLAGLVETFEQAVEDARRTSGENARGLELVLEEARRFLSEEGLVEVAALGQPFDHRVHQAVERVETDQQPESSIVGVVQRGYTLGGEVVRPALVRVAAAPKPTRDAAAHPKT